MLGCYSEHNLEHLVLCLCAGKDEKNEKRSISRGFALDNELCLHTDYWKPSDDYVNLHRAQVVCRTLLIRRWSAVMRSTAAVQVDTKDKLVKV